MLAVVAPGQGAQVPGFLAPWLTRPSFAAGLARLSDTAGLDLGQLGTSGSAETLKDTAVAQPIIVAAGILAARELWPEPDDLAQVVGVFAGHSVGEFTVTALAGVLPDDEAVRLVRERGLGMAEASALVPTGMSAVVGSVGPEVVAAIEGLGLSVANHNGANQIVAAGESAALARLRAAPPDQTRVVPLQVAGAFHTRFMQIGQDRLARSAQALRPVDPVARLLSNADGAEAGSGADWVARLVAQVTRPVRWDLCMASMARMGVTGVLELPPAKTLSGLAKRALPDAELFI